MHFSVHKQPYLRHLKGELSTVRVVLHLTAASYICLLGVNSPPVPWEASFPRVHSQVLEGTVFVYPAIIKTVIKNLVKFATAVFSGVVC
jgi:hypothetical protein